MAVDRGGLQYSIVVEDRFGDTIRRFREDIEGARRAFAEFREEGSRRSRLTETLREQADAQRQLTRAKRDEASIDESARRRARQAAREREIQNSATRQGLNLSRQSRAAATAEQRARQREADAIRNLRREIQRLNQAQERGGSAVEQRRAEAAELRRLSRERQRLLGLTIRERLERERGISALRDETSQLRVEQIARDRVRAATERQAVAQAQLRRLQEQGLPATARLAGAAGNQELQAELIAQERIARALLEQQVQQRLNSNEKARALGLSRQLTGQLTAEQEAQERINRALRQQRVAQAEVRLRRDAGLPIDPATIRRAQGELANARRQTRLLRADINGVLPSIQRVVAAFLLFEGARVILGTFRALVAESLRFNAAIERAQLSIAGLVTAAGEVRIGLQGGATTAQQFAASLAIARDQTQELRRDALRTTATFQELLDALQVSIAPGISAGLDVDEIRQVTVLISQAATSLGVAQNQLAEEIRSVLTGAINVRTSRIATALGIRNEDIQQAREAGVLFDFLQGRLEAFNVSATQVAQSFEGLTQRIRDAVQVILGDSGADFFSTTRDLLREILGLLLEEGEPNQTIIAGLEPIFASLTRVVERFSDAIENLSLEGLQDRASSLGNALETVAAVVEGLAVGIAQGVGSLTQILGNTDDLQTIRDISRALGQVLTIVSALAIAGQALTLPFTLLVGSIARVTRLFGPLLASLVRFVGGVGESVALATALRLAIRRIGTALLGIASGPIGAIVAGFVLAVEGIREILNLITGVRLSLIDTARLLLSTVINAIEAVGAAIGFLIVRRLEQTVGLVVRVAGALAQLTGSDTLQSIANDLAQFEQTLDGLSDNAFAGISAQLQDVNDEYQRAAERARQSVEEEISGIVDAADDGTTSLLQLAGSISPVISTVQNEIQTAEENLRGLQETLQGLSRDFAAFGSGGATSNEGIQAQADAIQAQQTAESQLQALRSAQIGLEGQLREATEERLRLAQAEREEVDSAVRAIRVREAAQRALTEVSAQLALNEELLQQARGQGNEAEAQRLITLGETLRRQQALAQAATDQNDVVAQRLLVEDRLADLAERRIELENQIASNVADQDAISQQLEQTLLRIAQVEANRQALAALRGSSQLNDEIEGLRLELALQEQLARVGLSDAQRRSLEVTNRIQQLRLEAGQEERKLQIQIDQAAAAARVQGIDAASRLTLLRRAESLQEELDLRNAITDASVAQLENERRRQERLAEIEAQRARTRETLELQDRGDELGIRLERERELNRVIGDSALAQQQRAQIELNALRATNELRLRENQAQLRGVQLAAQAAELAGQDTIAANLRERAALLERVVSSEGELAQLEVQAQARQNREAAANAQIAALQRQNELDLLRAQVAQQTFLATAENQRFSQQVAQQVSQLRQLQLRSNLERQIADIQLEQVASARNLAAASGNGLLADALNAQLEGLREEQRLRARNLELQEQALQRELGRAELYRSGALSDGLLLGIDQFIQQYQSLAQAGEQIVTGALNATLNGISEAIDIIATSDNIREDLNALAGRVVQDILTQAFDALIRNLVADLLDNLAGGAIEDTLGAAAASAQLAAGASQAAAILAGAGLSVQSSLILGATQAAGILTGASLASAAGGVGASAAFAAEGGHMKKAFAAMSGHAAHYSAAVQAFAKGGKVKNTPAPSSRVPAGLDVRDRIPAWLRKDEFVVTPEAWKPFGLGFMQALNDGRLKPADFSSLLRQRVDVSDLKPKLGFADGGLATQAPASVAASTGFRRPSANAQGDSTFLPVQDQRSAERALTGGREPFLKLVRRYRTQVNNILS